MNIKKRIAIAGCEEFLHKNEDTGLLLTALREADRHAEVILWNKKTPLPGEFDDYLLLGCWNYPDETSRFIRWVNYAAAEGNLINPLPFILWNMDKSYLFDLAAAGSHIAPTYLVAPGTPLPSMEIPYVLKPTVSNAARGAAMYVPGHDAAAGQHLADIHQTGGAALLQHYIPEIEHQGEVSMIYLNGQFSHAICKSALLRAGAGLQDNLFFQATFSHHRPSLSQLRAGERVINTLYQRFDCFPVYARVDMVETSPDISLIMECELIEPVLFLQYCSEAVNKLVKVITNS